MASFTITAAPDTDIWRKPPHVDVFNAPTSSAPSTKISGPLSSFRSAQVSFSFAWSEQYDQAGLLLSFRPSSSSPSSSSATSTSTPPVHPIPSSSSFSSSTGSPHRWIKTGVELYNARPMLSTVSCARWADWSVSPLPLPLALVPQQPRDDREEEESWTTIRIERVDGEHDDQEKGASLWVYQVLSDGEKNALREICWVYEDGADVEEDVWTVEVLAMAARPNKQATSGLEVKFRDLVVEWA